MVSVALACFDVALNRWSESGREQALTALVDEVFGFVQIPHTEPDS